MSSGNGWLVPENSDTGIFTSVADEEIFENTIGIGNAGIPINRPGTLRITFFNGDAPVDLRILNMVTAPSTLESAIPADGVYTTSLEVREGDSPDFSVSGASAGCRLMVSIALGGLI